MAVVVKSLRSSRDDVNLARKDNLQYAGGGANTGSQRARQFKLRDMINFATFL